MNAVNMAIHIIIAIMLFLVWAHITVPKLKQNKFKELICAQI